MFRPLWEHGRAIVFVDGWFEWKQPFFIYRKDGNPLMLAAIGKPPFENVNDQEGFLIVTAAASEGLLDIHDRRPLVYLADAARKWLSENLNCKEAEDIAREGSISAEDFIWHPVSRAVVNSRKPGPGTYRAAGLANGEIPCIHSQGYAPFLWITHSLFYSPEQQPGKSKKNYPCRTRNTSRLLCIYTVILRGMP